MALFFLVPFRPIKKAGNNFDKFIVKFLHWRLCVLRVAVLALLVLVGVDTFEIVKQIKHWKDEVKALPDELEDHFERFIKAVIAAELYVVLCLIVTFICTLRAYAANSSANYQSSSESIATGWLVNFFAPFILYVAVPLSYTFRMELLQTDVCTVSLASLTKLGSTFRGAFAQTAGGIEPKLAYVFTLPPPTMQKDLRLLDAWAGRQWCKDNPWTWEAKLFSTRWVKLSGMGVGMPTRDQIERLRRYKNVNIGVVPTALLRAGFSFGVPIDPEFMLCCVSTPVPQPASLLGIKARSGGNEEIVPTGLMQRAKADKYKSHQLVSWLGVKARAGEVEKVSPTGLMRRAKAGKRKSHQLGSWLRVKARSKEAEEVAPTGLMRRVKANKHKSHQLASWLGVRTRVGELEEITPTGLMRRAKVGKRKSADPTAHSVLSQRAAGLKRSFMRESIVLDAAGEVETITFGDENPGTHAEQPHALQIERPGALLTAESAMNQSTLVGGMGAIADPSLAGVGERVVAAKYSPPRSSQKLMRRQVAQPPPAKPIGVYVAAPVEIIQNESLLEPAAQPLRQRPIQDNISLLQNTYADFGAETNRMMNVTLDLSRAMVSSWFLAPRVKAEWASLLANLPTDFKAPLCNAYLASLGILRAGRLMRTTVRGILGFFVVVLAMQVLFPACMAVISGVNLGVSAVKEAIPEASLPGYLLLICTVAFLPGFMCLLAILSQQLGQPLISLGFFLFALSIAANMYKAKRMIEVNTAKSAAKALAEAESKAGRAKLLAGIAFLSWFGYIGYKISAGGPQAEEIQEALMQGLNMVDFGELMESAPMMATQMAASFLMVRCMTLAVSTDLMLIAVFDTADDELRARRSGTIDNDKEELLRDWHAIYPPRQKRGKKKKKNKDKKGGTGGDTCDGDPEAVPQPVAGEDRRAAATNVLLAQRGLNSPTSPQHGFFPSHS